MSHGLSPQPKVVCVSETTFLLLLLTPALLLLLWGILGASRRAAAAHAESQMHLPGQLAIEVGRTFAGRESKVWRLWFEDARIRYAGAEREWTAAYGVASSKQRRAMLARRLQLQADIDEFIDPVECLRRLDKIIYESMNDRSPQAPQPSESSVPG